MGKVLRVPYKMLSTPIPLEPFEFKNAALVLMDFQKFTCSREDGLGLLASQRGISPELDEYFAQVEAALGNAFRLLETCRSTELKVIFTYLYSEKGKNQISRQFQVSHLPIPTGKIEDEFHNKLVPAPDEHILTRGTYSPFIGTKLHEILQEEGKDTLILAGTLFNYSVVTAAREAADLGYNVIVVWNASASETLDWHLAMRTGIVGGLILSRSAEDVIEMIEGKRT